MSGDLERVPARHARRPLTAEERTQAIKLLEMQRHALLMYTSCGWFFDEISGIETVQVLMYAGRMIQLTQETCEAILEPAFLERLALAPSNVAHLHATGREVYEKYVLPARLGWQNVAAHYAVASLFQSFEETSHIFCYDLVQKAVRRHDAGNVKLIVGHARLDSEITLESFDFAYAALHLGDHNVNAGVAAYPGDLAYEEIAAGLAEAFARVETPQVLRLMDRAFGEASYSIASLFRDLQRQVLKKLLRERLTEITAMYQRVFDLNVPLMRFLQHVSAPIPMPLHATAEVLFNSDLRWAFKDDAPDFEQIRGLVKRSANLGASARQQGIGFPAYQDARPSRPALAAKQPDMVESLECSRPALSSRVSSHSSPTSGPPRTFSSTSAPVYSTTCPSWRRATPLPQNGSRRFCALVPNSELSSIRKKKRRMTGEPGPESQPMSAS